jgi:taurine transport system permease protein
MSEIQPAAQDMPSPKESVPSATEGRDAIRFLPLLGVGTLIVVVAVWWTLTSWLEIVPPLYFPTPEEVIERIGRLSGVLIADALATLIRVIASWVVGSALGILVGLAMVRSQVLYALLSPVIEALRPIPPVALIPFVILWFGIGDDGKIFLGALACFMVMVINTIVSAQNLSPVYMRAARSLGASDRQIYRTVVLPGIVPELVSGLRIGSALAFAVIVAAEFLGAESGIGRLIMLASRTLDTPVVLLGTIVIGLEAFLVERVIKLGATRATRWAERSSD